MISLSHWGMFSNPRPPFMVAGFKLSDVDGAAFCRPDGIVRLTRLEVGEPQPIYVAPDGDCA